MFRNTKLALMFGAACCGTLSGTAFAQGSDDANAGTGDIIVTARRVEERLQDVPISITVFNQEQLTQRNVAIASDLATYTPSLSVNQRFGSEKISYSIRGFNQDSGTAPTVGVYFAEVVGVRAQGGTASGNTVGAGAFTDLQNVQVLKGPQGTLFGRNTTGGAILLTPVKPTANLEGFVEGTYGNYDQMRVQAALNIPLAETFKVRIAIDRNKRDGYMHNLSGIGPKDYNDTNYIYARLGIVADLTPDLENYTLFHYSDSHTHGYGSHLIGCATPNSPVNPLVVDRNAPGYLGTRQLQAASCVAQLARETARGDGPYDFETTVANPFMKLVQWQAINTTTWRISDDITLKNIASYGEFREQSSFDLNPSNFAVPATDTGIGLTGQPTTGFDVSRINPLLPKIIIAAGTPYQRIVLDTAGPNTYNSAQSTFTEEFQIQGKSIGGKLNYVLGGYLELSRPIGFSAGRTGIFLNCVRAQDANCTNPLLFGSISESSTKFNFNNNGIFGQATYNVTDKLAFTGGIRYTFDKISGFSNSTRASFSANAGTGPLFTDPIGGRQIARACTDSFRHGPLALAIAGLAPPGLNRDVCVTRLTNKSTEPTWLANIDYKFTPDFMVYAKYARGYRQGGLNFTNPGLETWGPEKMDTYEVGLKTGFRGAITGYFNVSAFYNSLSDQQVGVALVPSPAGAAVGVAGGNGTINAGKSRIYGAEVDASATVLKGLRFDLAYTYLNTKVTDIATPAELQPLLVGTPFGFAQPTTTVGAPFTNTPKHRISLGASYTLPLDDSVGRISFGANWVHSSSYINDGTSPASINGVPLGVSPSSDLVNLNLDWRGVAGSPFDLALFATNVTNERYNVANLNGWPAAGVADVIYNPPRFYGVRVKYSFSE